VTAPITEIRALLRQFERSPLKDLYYRSSEWTVFLARQDGGANPLHAARDVTVDAPGPDATTVAVSAPHLGMFEPRCAIGDVVEAGGLLAVIDVLGRQTEVRAGQGGVVGAVVAASGGLIEFGEVLVELRL
jgi:biotin carboxyl carrier protein